MNGLVKQQFQQDLYKYVCLSPWRFKKFFLGWSLKNLNYTKLNKAIN